MDANQLKAMAARAALAHVPLDLPGGAVVGVGTGSTVNHFIDALAEHRQRVRAAVSSSEASTQRLRAHGIAVVDAASVDRLPVYVDGADEIDPHGHMIKGGGAALTREKIVAELSDRFVCIADASKLVPVLGRFALPVEVIAMASTHIAAKFAAMGARAQLRPGVLTDNGHPILDVHGLSITDPKAMEADINQWPGVVTVGIFARNRAQVCLLATPDGVQTVQF